MFTHPIRLLDVTRQVFFPCVASGELPPDPLEMLAGSPDFGFHRPTAEHGVGGTWQAGKGDDPRSLRNDRRTQIAQRPRSHAVHAEVFGPCLRPEFDAAADAVGDVVLLVLVFARNSRRVSAQVFKHVGMAADGETEDGRLRAPAQPVEPVARGDDVAGVAVFEITIDVAHDDGVEINEQGHALQSMQLLAPKSDLRPLARHIGRDFTTQRRQGKAVHLRPDTGGIVGETSELERTRDVPLHHAV